MNAVSTAKAVDKNNGFHHVEDPAKREHLPMPWDERADDAYAPMDNWLFYFDYIGGGLAPAQATYGRHDDRKQRYATKVDPIAGWPLNGYLNRKTVENICRYSHERGVSLARAFVAVVGKSALPPDFIAKCKEAPPIYYRPVRDAALRQQHNQRPSHGGYAINTGLTFDFPNDSGDD
jgi:hypothetical protein